MDTALRLVLLTLVYQSLTVPAYALDMAKYVVAEEITGTVVDTESGQPIPGAVVAIRFERNNTGHGSPHCFRSMAVETDTRGRFRFASWKQADTKANATFGQVTAYKAGKAIPRPLVVNQAMRSVAGVAFSDTITIPKAELRLQLAPFVGTPDDRMKQLGPLLSEFACRWQAEFDDAKLLTVVSEEIQSTSVANVKMPGGGTAGQWIEGFLRSQQAK